MLFQAWIVLSSGGGVFPLDNERLLCHTFQVLCASASVFVHNAPTTPECGILNDFFNLRVGLYPNH
jgi:hypothetical protein